MLVVGNTGIPCFGRVETTVETTTVPSLRVTASREFTICRQATEPLPSRVQGLYGVARKMHSTPGYVDRPAGP